MRVSFSSEIGMGDQKLLNAGGGARPESCPSRTWTFDAEDEDLLFL